MSFAGYMEGLQRASSAIGKKNTGEKKEAMMGRMITTTWPLTHTLQSLGSSFLGLTLPFPFIPIWLRDAWFFTLLGPNYMFTGSSRLTAERGMCLSRASESHLFLGVPSKPTFHHLISRPGHRVCSCQQLSFQICCQGDSSPR